MLYTDEIAKVVKKETNKIHAKIGIGFKDLDTDYEYFLNEDDKFLTASVFKVFVIIELYNQALKGIINLNTRLKLSNKDKSTGSGVLQYLHAGLKPTIKDLAKLMMIISDNTATDIIIDLIGKENINRTLKELELYNTKVMYTTKEILYDLANAKDIKTAMRNLKISRINKDANVLNDYENNDVTTPKDMVRTLELLYKKKILTPKACNEIINIMKDCQTGEARLKRFLPSDVKVAHKTGTLPGVVNDAGIIFTKKKDYILAIFIN
jgi:beta-lactamase class A